MLRLILLAVLLLLAGPTLAQSAHPAFAGDWSSRIKINGEETPVILHLVPADTGGFTLSVDLPERQRYGMTPPGGSTFEGRTMTFRVGAAEGFAGSLSADGDAIEGTYTTGATGRPLRFVRTPAASSAGTR